MDGLTEEGDRSLAGTLEDEVAGGKMPSFLSSDDVRKSLIDVRLAGLPSATLDGLPGELE